MKSRSINTAIVSTAIALAPQAGASNQDDNFLALLAQAGIPAHDGIPGVIAMATKCATALNGGQSPSSIADTLAQYAYAEDPSHPAGPTPAHNVGVRPGVVAGILRRPRWRCCLSPRLPHCPHRPGTAPSAPAVAAAAGYGPHDGRRSWWPSPSKTRRRSRSPRRHLRWPPRPRRVCREAEEGVARVAASTVAAAAVVVCSLPRSHPKVTSHCCPEAAGKPRAP